VIALLSTDHAKPQPIVAVVRGDENLRINMRTFAARLAYAITSPLCCQVVGEAVCSCACECGPVLAGVKVGPARARGADPGGAPPGPRLRAGWFGAYQEQAEVSAAVDRCRF